MAIVYKGAAWKPLGPQIQPRMSSHDIVCLHTMVGSLSGTDGMFKANGYGGTESHFGVGYDGRVIQWQDLEYTADANYAGSRNVISIETADYGEGPFGKWDTRGDNVPEWTPAQIESIAKIVAWCCKQYNIPCQLIPDTKPGRRGIGYHAQGVPGNGLVPGGVVWSKARGKVCPGKRRIAQIPQVIKRASLIMGGTPTPTPAPTPVKERLFMHLSEAEERAMLRAVLSIETMVAKAKFGQALPARSPNARIKTDDQYGHTMNAEAEAADGRVAVEKALKAVQELITALKAKGIL